MTLGGSRTSNPVDICQSNAYSSWFHKAARTCHLLGGSADKITIKESETFALNIYSLGNLIYNKRKPDSKISIRISSWLQVEGRSSVKVSHSVHGLEEKDSQYVLLEGPTYYFHASSKAGLTFAVRTAMCELMDHSDHPGSAQVVACE